MHTAISQQVNCMSLKKVETMQFSPQEPVDTLITDIDNLADIVDLAGFPITDGQRTDIGYIFYNIVHFSRQHFASGINKQIINAHGTILKITFRMNRFLFRKWEKLKLRKD